MTTFVPEPHLLDSPRGRDWAPGPVSAPRPAGADEVPATADVVIVGAGPAGLATASALWHLGVHDVVLLDRDGRPCGRFFDRIDTLKQRVLRSPYEHHPGVEGYRDCELLDFARLNWSRLTPVERREIRMAQAGHRSVVPVDVFEAYCRHVATLHHVEEPTGRTPKRSGVAERLNDDEWNEMRSLIRRFAETELDQWVAWRTETSYGTVYIEISRAPRPGASDDASDPY